MVTEINIFCEFVDISLQLASGIYNFACSLWNHHTDTFLQQVSSGNEAAVLSSLERTLLSLKGTVQFDMFISEMTYLKRVTNSSSGGFSAPICPGRMRG